MDIHKIKLHRQAQLKTNHIKKILNEMSFVGLTIEDLQSYSDEDYLTKLNKHRKRRDAVKRNAEALRKAREVRIAKKHAKNSINTTEVIPNE